MLGYIWLNDKLPILKQIPNNFKSVAIVLHPFVQMPSGWSTMMRGEHYQHIYPSDAEVFRIGKAVSWRKVMSDSGLNSYEELALALITSIGAFQKEYAREDLADKLNFNIKSDVFYPPEDSTSIFLIDSLLKLIGSEGADKLYFSEPIFDNSGVLSIKDTNPLDICSLSDKELFVTDENMDYAFMSLYDSFTTVLLAKDENIERIVQSMNLEAIICDERMSTSWYFK